MKASFGNPSGMPRPKPTLTMPKTLTYENGAKSALMGEFHVNVTVQCLECDREQDHCEVCGGLGEYCEVGTISWTAIKEIYEKAVEHFENNPELVDK